MQVKLFTLILAAAAMLTTVESAFAQTVDGAESLNPLMNVVDQVTYTNDFSQANKVDKTDWQSRQGTQWEIVDRDPHEWDNLAGKIEHAQRKNLLKQMLSPHVESTGSRKSEICLRLSTVTNGTQFGRMFV
jgi:hypothetical protein